MNNKFIRILSLVLVFSVIFSFTAFAEEAIPSVEETTSPISENVTDYVEETTEPDTPSEPEEPSEPTEPEIPEDPTEPDTPEEPDEPEVVKPAFDELSGDTIVAKMYICSQVVFLGHAWIYIESCFDGEIPVGAYTMKPYGSVSVGTFLFSRADGMGVYYNVERYCANEYGLKKQVWLGMDITKDQLIKVSDEIKNWNYWDPYFNCTFFASKVWNSVSNKFMMPMMFPAFTSAQIRTQGGNSNVVMQDVERTDCYKQKGTGNDVRLEVVKDRTLNSRLL